MVSFSTWREYLSELFFLVDGDTRIDEMVDLNRILNAALPMKETPKIRK